MQICKFESWVCVEICERKEKVRDNPKFFGKQLKFFCPLNVHVGCLNAWLLEWLAVLLLKAGAKKKKEKDGHLEYENSLSCCGTL